MSELAKNVRSALRVAGIRRRPAPGAFRIRRQDGPRVLEGRLRAGRRRGVSRVPRRDVGKAGAPDLRDVARSQGGPALAARLAARVSVLSRSERGARVRARQGRRARAGRRGVRRESSDRAPERSLPGLPPGRETDELGREPPRERESALRQLSHDPHQGEPDAGDRHPPERALQAEPVRDLLQVPPGAAGAELPLLHAPAASGQDRVQRLPQPARLDGAEAARAADPQRDLLPVPRGEARAVPVGASAGPRELRDLSRGARLEQPAAARQPVADAVPAVPHVGLPPEHRVYRPRSQGGSRRHPRGRRRAV